MKKYIFWLVLLLALAATACKKKADPEPIPPDLPPATEVGANTFGCYFNGVPWTPRTNSPYCLWCSPILDAGYEYAIGSDGPYFRMTAKKQYENGTEERIRIFCGKLLNIGTYSLKKQTEQGCSIVRSIPNASVGNIDIFSYDADVIEDGELIITKIEFRSTGVIIAGRFWFKLQKGNEVYETKDGRFDVLAR